ncbi:MAG: sigma-70 family RNA polymerase sigma factor [Planctomycetes bacterium]|nr:sigma-70 family RNA polymerase sigma factor [Planctomycetota bacterium]
MAEFDDNKLLNDLIQGDPEAFDALITEFQDRVVNTCARFVNNLQDAEDVAQNVFIEVYQSVNRFRGQSRLSTWIYRIAVTKSLDFVRRMTRKKRMGRVKRLIGVGLDEEDMSIDPPDSGPSPHEDMETREQAALLNQAISTLPENQRTAIILTNYEQLSQAEVSKIMGNTVSAVESLIHRAKHNLRQKLTAYYEKNMT